MGNTIGAGRRIAKVMTIDGETVKFKTPLKVGEVTKDYPGHVLIESEAVKHFGVRAKPLEPQQDLKPRRLYFLLEKQKFPQQEKNVLQRKVRPGVKMSAKERMESLMLTRRATSDLSSVKSKTLVNDAGMVRVKLRLPKSELSKLMDESQDAKEAAEKIMDLCITKTGMSSSDEHEEDDMYTKSGPLLGYDSNDDTESGPLRPHGVWKPALDSIKEGSNKPRREKKVKFLPVKDEEEVE
ncbi:uncharacterized protein At1g66480 [Macadamia integrifolia]|uniref:uncharacterized protein At1g66480 n=1 Tax=Macadamia integrifolia TaxID=60698 RepID=UPI001C4F8EF9|nr:uncharacterized protein At1g66480 [Macadamia integrifolia]